jgi:hypothetical protein
MVSLDIQAIHQGLRPFRNLKGHEYLGVTIDHIRFYFDVLIASILVKQANAFHALREKLLTEFSL